MHHANGERSGRTYPTSQDAKRSLMDIHNGIVFPFVTIHLLKHMLKEEIYNIPFIWGNRECLTWMQKFSKEIYLIKVQPHYDVWLFCELMHCFQEVHMANVLQETSQDKLTKKGTKTSQ